MPEALSSAVAAVVRRLCDERQMSGRALARATGMPVRSIGDKLAERTPFALDDLPKVADALGVDVADLMAWARQD